MILRRLLSKNKAAIQERWFQLILETYPLDVSRFLKQEKDRFNNPVGYSISQGIKAIYEELLQGGNQDKLVGFFNDIIRIRSIQDFSPSSAIAFIFLLKKAVRDELANKINGVRALTELLEFESRVDEMALLAFDVYMKCREKLYEIRVKEVNNERDRALKILEREELTREKLNPNIKSERI